MEQSQRRSSSAKHFHMSMTGRAEPSTVCLALSGCGGSVGDEAEPGRDGHLG